MLAVREGPRRNCPRCRKRLETLGISVVGYRTSEFPGFHYAGTGIPVPARCDDIETIVATHRAQRSLGHPAALLVVQPPPADAALDREMVEAAIESALVRGRGAGIRGAGTTPWLLAELSRVTGGRTLDVNLALLESNARLAAALAARLAKSDS